MSVHAPGEHLFRKGGDCATLDLAQKEGNSGQQNLTEKILAEIGPIAWKQANIQSIFDSRPWRLLSIPGIAAPEKPL